MIPGDCAAPVDETPCATCRALADALGAASVPTLRTLADGAPLTPALASAVAVELCAAGRRFSALAVRCTQALLEIPPLPHDPDSDQDSPWPADLWLCLAQLHALRRAGAEAVEAAARARALLAAAGDGPNAALGAARCDLVAGSAALARGRHAEALALLAQAQAACAAAGDWSGQVEALLELARCHAEQTRFADAARVVDAAAELAGVDAWLACRVEIQRADTWFSQTRYPDAAAAYCELVARCDAQGWRLDGAHIRLMQGLLMAQQGDFSGAEVHMQAAMQSYVDDACDYYVAVCRRGLASLYWRTGRYEAAEAAAEAALATFTAIGHTAAIGRCYHALGLINQAWNRYDAALAAYERALACFEGAHLPHEQLTALKNQAIIQEDRGYYHAALAIYERVLAGGRAAGLVFLEATTLHSMAMLNGRLGRYAEAVTCYRRARRVYRRSRSEFDAHVAVAQQAGVLHLMGQEGPARRLLGQARRYFRANGRAGALAFCDLTAGEIAAASGRFRAALRFYGAALAHFLTSGQGTDAALCRLGLGETCLAAGDPAAAGEQLTAALPAFVPGFPDMAARAEHLLGRVAQAQNQPRAAAEHWDRAVAYVSTARRGIVTEQHAGSFFEARRPIYEDALDGWLAVGEPAAGLRVAEASKGQVLAALLEQGEVVSAAFLGQTPAVRALWEQTWAVSRELDSLRARGPASEAGSAHSLIAHTDALQLAAGDTAGRLAGLAEQQSALFEKIRRSAASYDLLDPGRPSSLAQFRAQAEATCGPRWAALAYYLRRDRLDIFWVTADTVRAWRRSLSRLDLAKLRHAVDPEPEARELLYAGRLRGMAQPDPPGRRILGALAALLIPPELHAELAPDRRLLIAPHGLLHYLPFQALILPDGRPLLRHAAVSYAPTLRVWEGLARRAAARTRDAMGRALFCGVSDFGDRAPALRCSEIEAHDLAAQFGPRATLLLGGAASLDRLQAWSDGGTLAGFDIVHLATHAVFNGARPLTSRILLADGGLAVPDLFRLRLNARLVTLSACQTALSRLEPGDELLGLREALLFAGAGALLVSLWQVDDAVTGRLMARFYAALLAGAQPVEALAAAQRDLRDEGEPAFNWAPFVMIG